MAYTFDHPGRKLLHNTKKILGPYVKPGMTAMDVGCGMGFFSIAMAKLVGDEGAVVAVDLQQKMLDVLMKRARRAGVAHRIRTHRCAQDHIGVDEPVDFILACYVVHETPDQKKFLEQVRVCLKPEAKFLIIEPGWHVPKDNFARTLDTAKSVGLNLVAQPHLWVDRTALVESS